MCGVSKYVQVSPFTIFLFLSWILQERLEQQAKVFSTHSTTIISCRYEGMDKFIKTKLQLQPNSVRFVATKVAMDGILFGPIHLLVFFTYMGFSAGKTLPQVKEDLKRDFIPALLLEGSMWPVVQSVNFRYIPVKYQLLYVNLFCLVDSVFLSWLEQQKDAPWKQWFMSSRPLKEKGDQSSR